MLLKDIRNYRGYMPVRMEREDVLYWLGGLIGGGWYDGLWVEPHSGYHEIRYRFGDIQEAQLYLTDKTWRGMPLRVWLQFSGMDSEGLDAECWEWIKSERLRTGGCARKASVKSSTGILDF